MNKNLSSEQRQEVFAEVVARVPRGHEATAADIEIMKAVREAQEQLIAESVGAQAVEAVGSAEAE